MKRFRRFFHRIGRVFPLLGYFKGVLLNPLSRVVLNLKKYRIRR